MTVKRQIKTWSPAVLLSSKYFTIMTVRGVMEGGIIYPAGYTLAAALIKYWHQGQSISPSSNFTVSCFVSSTTNIRCFDKTVVKQLSAKGAKRNVFKRANYQH